MNVLGAVLLAPTVLLSSAVGVSGTGCAAPNDSAAEAEAGSATAPVLPAGFDQWLHDQCPDGSMVQIIADRVVHEIPCGMAREQLITNAASRERLMSAYMEQTEEPINEAVSGERIGEARQRGVISSLLCGFIVSAALGYQCHRVNAHWSDCWAAGVPPSILCAFIPIPF